MTGQLYRGSMVDAADPAIDLIPITPNDNADLASPARSIRCKPTGAAGNLSVITAAGNQRDTSIAAGETLSLQVVRVRSTGTTATGLEALV